MSDGHTTKEKNNYSVTFHPAFASRCVVNGEDGECEVYRQSTPHELKGQPHPKKHKIHLKGGKFDRDLTLEIHDPKHAIKRIHLELYGDRTEADLGGEKTFATAETFTADNHANTCPPICVEPPPEG
jgi:hypothetical protein